jgi:SAM-dependent methyltransferase
LNRYSDAKREIDHFLHIKPDSKEARQLLSELDFIFKRNTVLRRLELEPKMRVLRDSISKIYENNPNDDWMSHVKDMLDIFLREISDYCRSQHTEYQVHKAPWSGGYFIEKEKQLEQYIKCPGNVDNCFAVGFDERIVEIPWVVNELNSYSTVLDAGSALNHSVILKHLTLQKLYIATLYPENYHDPSGINYVYEDLRDLPFKNQYFDAVASISTIEHIGLECSIYKNDEGLMNRDTTDGNYIDAVLEMKRITKPGGKIFISAPFGKRGVYHNSFRQFDYEMVMELIECTIPVQYEVKYFAYTANGWKLSSPDFCKDFSYRENNSPGAGAVYLLSMTI